MHDDIVGAGGDERVFDIVEFDVAVLALVDLLFDVEADGVSDEGSKRDVVRCCAETPEEGPVNGGGNYDPLKVA